MSVSINNTWNIEYPVREKLSKKARNCRLMANLRKKSINSGFLCKTVRYTETLFIKVQIQIHTSKYLVIKLIQYARYYIHMFIYVYV